MIEAIVELMEYETAGDPMSGLRWTRKTTFKISEELRRLGIVVSPKTVARLLKGMGYSLRVNHKKVALRSSPDREEQFAYLAELREDFLRRGQPTVSVDTKKRELVGLFKNDGRAWQEQPIEVYDHDFRSSATGVAVPYGIYDVTSNRGALFIGVSRDTSEFAATSISKWWRYRGGREYSGSNELLILADCGGSNAPRCRAWKWNLQKKLADRHQLRVTVAHYPSGASKWNPIEHRLFSEISKNWAGRPLDTYETILRYAQSTTTTTGLRVDAYLDSKDYRTGVKISDAAMREVAITPHSTLPQWNYTISPN